MSEPQDTQRRNFLSFVDIHVPEGRLHRYGVSTCPGRYPIPLEHFDQTLITAIHQKVERDALSANQDVFGYNS